MCGHWLCLSELMGIGVSSDELYPCPSTSMEKYAGVDEAPGSDVFWAVERTLEETS